MKEPKILKTTSNQDVLHNIVRIVYAIFLVLIFLFYVIENESPGLNVFTNILGEWLGMLWALLIPLVIPFKKLKWRLVTFFPLVIIGMFIAEKIKVYHDFEGLILIFYAIIFLIFIIISHFLFRFLKKWNTKKLNWTILIVLILAITFMFIPIYSGLIEAKQYAEYAAESIAKLNSSFQKQKTRGLFNLQFQP